MLSKQMEQMMFMTQQQIVQQFQFQERIFMFLLKQQQPWPAVGLGSGQITNVSKPLEMYYLERFSEMQGNSLSVSLQGMYTVNIFLLNESLSLSLSQIGPDSLQVTPSNKKDQSIIPRLQRAHLFRS